MRYWLMKSEPNCYSIDDLAAAGGPAMWEGCRNYQVRNMFRDMFEPGDRAFFHYSNAKPSGIVGTMRIVSKGYPDPTQFDPNSEHPDPKSRPEAPTWLCVDVNFETKFDRIITMDELRSDPRTAGMQVLRRGQRLSVMSVESEEWAAVLEMAARK